ncbi:hypothetical protein [Nitratireductor sp. CH_MIT9313-5]|uniref:hypothetical protein n=1 Tax=Nitratireductor sp. CH_MIT9313-5 TaxID=3107764 RepID=UPI00300AE9D3
MINIKQTKAGDITIRIPRSYLRYAVSMAEFLPEGTRVTNTKAFSDAIVRKLECQEEDGTTPVHLMLDGAIDRAFEDGEEGIHCPDYD